ncbi:uncharacterized protein PV09_02887 [Verruconis gallopava]|uniref:Enoyl reductase (ER) domain-containing protein n=1 Tax=Verruconis gallopava TaxID=253628 RepID=A0A0D2AHS9_9PEZI|nr:uncharacterized protein PV09_02887 [Verruconis gallopava]KIW06443.1 hypothetical protein PV09_02887 [Verruconis gallopava]
MASTSSEQTFEIPKTCIGGVVVNEGPDFRVEVRRDIPVPEIGPDDVLIKLNATGICHSDIHFMLADLGIGKMSDYGVKCAGHEGAGVIVKVGENCKRLKVGQRAGFKPIENTCGMCELCRTDKECYCPEATYVGLHVDGTYQQYVKSPERYTTLIPDGVSDYIAGPIMCSASTIYCSLKESGIRPGNWAVFPGGGGGVGIQGVQLAAAMGFRPIVVDTGDEKKKQLCKDMGAEAFIDFKTSDDPIKEVVALTDGIGAHAVFVTASQAYPTAQGYLGSRVGGVVMCIGLPPAGKYSMTIPPTSLIFRNQKVMGTLVANLADVDETLQFAKRGKLKLPANVVGLSQWNEACQNVKNGLVAGRYVVDFNKE